MLTFFTTAKPFHHHSAIIQRNALQSWKLLHPDVEVILFGDDDGAAEVCAKLGLRHEPHVERHASGLKYLNYMFDRAQQIASHGYLCYSNCDIILMSDFRAAFEKAVAWRKDFLMVARRWDTDVTEPIDFTSDDWPAKLLQRVRATGHLQSPDFVDFFLFPKGLYDAVPPLVVGRDYWDHWLVAAALNRRAALLDATRVVVPVHQNHGYGYHPAGKLGTHTDQLAGQNLHFLGGLRRARMIDDATYLLTKSGIRPNRLALLAAIRRPFARVSRRVRGAMRLHVWHPLLDATRPLRHKLGIKYEKLVPASWQRFRRRLHWLD